MQYSEWKSLYCNTQTNTKDEGRESLPPQDLLQHALETFDSE